MAQGSYEAFSQRFKCEGLEHLHPEERERERESESEGERSGLHAGFRKNGKSNKEAESEQLHRKWVQVPAI